MTEKRSYTRFGMDAHEYFKEYKRFFNGKNVKERARNTAKSSGNPLDVGAAYGILNKHEKVIETLTEYIKKDPTEIDALYNIGVAYFNLGEYQKALRYFATIIKLDDLDKISGIYGWGYERGDFDRGFVFAIIADIYEKLGEHNKSEACSHYSFILTTEIDPFRKLEKLSPEEQEAYKKLLDTIFLELHKITHLNSSK